MDNVLSAARRTILQTWDQAGPQPFSYIEELGMAPDLLAMLANSTLDLEQALYRGTTIVTSS